MWTWYYNSELGSIDAERTNLPGDDTKYFARVLWTPDYTLAEVVYEMTRAIGKFEAKNS